MEVLSADGVPGIVLGVLLPVLNDGVLFPYDLIESLALLDLRAYVQDLLVVTFELLPVPGPIGLHPLHPDLLLLDSFQHLVHLVLLALDYLLLLLNLLLVVKRQLLEVR